MNFTLAFMLMVAGGDVREAWKGVFSLFFKCNWMVYAIYMNEFPLL